MHVNINIRKSKSKIEYLSIIQREVIWQLNKTCFYKGVSANILYSNMHTHTLDEKIKFLDCFSINMKTFWKNTFSLANLSSINLRKVNFRRTY